MQAPVWADIGHDLFTKKYMYTIAFWLAFGAVAEESELKSNNLRLLR